MDLSKDEAQDYVNELENDAEEIEEHIGEFCEGVFTKTATIGTFRVKEYNAGWSIPSADAKEAQRNGREKYEKWYASAVPLIEEYLPEKVGRFKKKYDEFKNHISLNEGSDSVESYADPSLGWWGLHDELIDIFDEQRNLVKAIPAKIEAEKLKARRQLSARMVRDEIQRARELFDDDFIRAAGVIAAVALERHLLTMCENSDEVSDYEPNHGIARLSQTLYEADIIGKTTWNDLKALASIRETCAHAEEPEQKEVRRLINDAEEFIRTHEA